MAKIDDLLQRVLDEPLRQQLTDAISGLRRNKDFGLVFEPHLPETVRLPGHPVRRGVKVTARKDLRAKTVWMVLQLNDDVATLQQTINEVGSRVKRGDAEPEERPVDDLVVVAEVGDPIYPGLKAIDSLDAGGDKPSHVVINGENHHALEAMRFSHAGKLDCIYIDPPYNTGNRDWIYNNRFVEPKDDYKHSKWLAFMERRLLVAKDLLAENSSLVVAIDEHEVSRLGLLLEQTFPSAEITMVTIVMNPKGVTRQASQRLSRVEEYIYVCFFGDASISGWGDDLLTLGANDIERSADVHQPLRPRWKGLLRSGTNARRADRKKMFYPVLIDNERNAVVGTGDPLDFELAPDFDTKVNGHQPVWPVRSDGSLGNWGVGPSTLRTLIEKGYVAVGGHDEKRNTWALSYLSKQPQEQIAAGILEILDFDEKRNVVDVAYADPESETRRVKTVWHRTSHDAGAGGSDVVSKLVGGKYFTFPKSVFAVRDVIAMLTGSNPDAIIADFFAGSGTTAHAVAMLNAEDGGRRQSILITNNELKYEDQTRLAADGRMPGDPEWEAEGVFTRVTKPRIEAAITGKTADGEPLAGSLKNNDGTPMSNGYPENVRFLELTYEDIIRVEAAQSYEAVAHLLWLRAGAIGPVLTTNLSDDGAAIPFGTTPIYGILFDTDHWQAFVQALAPTTTTVFIVTDSITTYTEVAAELPTHVVDRVRLYQRYLTTFAINTDSAN